MANVLRHTPHVCDTEMAAGAAAAGGGVTIPDTADDRLAGGSTVGHSWTPAAGVGGGGGVEAWTEACWCSWVN